jgi:hypothetical protein
MKTKGKFKVSEELIGKYINRSLWSDVNPVGKIIAIKSKTKVIIQPVEAGENLVKMEYIPGGFAGHCVNQREQKYEFSEFGEPFEASLSNTSMRQQFWYISEAPRKYYDYNF